MYGLIGKLALLKRGAEGGTAAKVRLPPRRLAEPVLRLLGWLMYMLMVNMRAAVKRNMASVLAEREGGQPIGGRRLRGSVRGYFIHGAMTLYELFAESGKLPDIGEERVRLLGEEHLQNALKDGKGAILYAPHMGNFFYYYWRLSRHYDCLAVATAGSPELRPIYLRFEEMGCKGLDYDGTPPLALMRRLRKHLAAGGVLLLLGDFYRPSFPPARLFGRPSRGLEGAALLAIEEGAPVIPCWGFREERGMGHRFMLEEPIRLHEAYGRSERSCAMLELNHRLEAAIRSRPEQWFYWFNVHERWSEGG